MPKGKKRLNKRTDDSVTSEFDLSDESPVEDEQKVALTSPPPGVPAKKAPPAPVEPLLTFDRWFISLGRPSHHKAGMQAYRPTKGRKTKAAWDRLFKDY